MAEKKYPTSKITFQGIGRLKGVDGYTAPVVIYGCTDPAADNYDSTANSDDGTCTYTIYGCMDEFTNGILNINYNPLATVNEVSDTDSSNPCIAQVLGCMDDGVTSNYQLDRPSTWQGPAENYDATLGVNTSDGSCTYWVYGCMDSTALNYNALATFDDGSCIPIVNGCMDDGYCTDNPDHFNPNSNDFLGPQYHLCEDSSGISYNSDYPGIASINYNAAANVDDASCNYSGCTDTTALNYNSLAQIDDGSCTYTVVDGCTDSTACNYDPLATNDDGSCILPDGCTDAGALNYDTNADCDDSSCVFPLPPNNIPVCDINIIGAGGGNNSNVNIQGGYNGPLFIDGSTQELQISAQANTGSYPPTKIQYTVNYGTTAPTDGSTSTVFSERSFGPGSSAWESYSSQYDNSLKDKRPTANGTITCTFTFKWENGNGGTVIHTETLDRTINIVVGCLTTQNAVNYAGQLPLDSSGNQQYYYQTQANPVANWDSSDCISPQQGCMDPTAINYAPGANYDSDPSSCMFLGCTDDGTNSSFPGRPSNAAPGPASNYDPNATIDDGSCTWSIPQAFNPVTLDINLIAQTDPAYELTHTPTGWRANPINYFYGGFYCYSVVINLSGTMSAHRQPAQGGNANEPYSTTFEYSLGCAANTNTFTDLWNSNLNYEGAGWTNSLASSGIGDYQLVNGGPQGSITSVEASLNQTIGTSISNSLFSSPNSNTSAIFNNPSTFQSITPPFTGNQVNLQGFDPVPAELAGGPTTTLIAHIPYSVVLSHFGGGSNIRYAFRVTTEDSLGVKRRTIIGLEIYGFGLYNIYTLTNN